jgi:lipopolysaccharide export system permease protein
MILVRYINKEFFIGISMIMIGLISLFAFFDFIQEIGDLGKGSYGIIQAISFVILSIPGHIYEVVPLAVLIGSMYTIGQLSYNSELNVLRASGYSIKKIAWSLMYVGILFSFFTVLIGDFIAPHSEKSAQQIKIISTNSSVSQEFSSGFWIKDGDNFVNIENVLPDSSLEQIHIYEFDENFNLRTIVDAKNGSFKNGEWKLKDIKQTILDKDSVKTKTIESGSWKSLMRPEMMNALIISPQKMSSINLLKFINYLKKNNQKSTKFEVALWEKLIHPLMPLVMIIFAIPFGFLQERSGGKFFKMFVGIIIGIVYQILNTMIRHLSLLNDWQPFISSLIPTLIFLSIGIFLINKFEYK